MAQEKAVYWNLINVMRVPLLPKRIGKENTFTYLSHILKMPKRNPATKRMVAISTIKRIMEN